jgi:hypothetical protein
MIILKQNWNNSVIYTASSMLDTPSDTYVLKLTNCQTNSYLTASIYDISEYKYRYNKSYVELVTLPEENWEVATASIDEDVVKFIRGDVEISGHLEIEGLLVIFDGEITGSYTGDVIKTTYSQVYTLAQTTYIFNLGYGYYDYIIYKTELNPLEVGNILVGLYTQTAISYGADIQKIIYER